MKKHWINKMSLRQKICFIILFFGVCATAYGYFAGDNFVGQILTNFGCGVLSGSILALIIFPDDKRTEEWYQSVYKKWGLQRIHINRGRIFYREDTNDPILPSKELDYIAFGLVGFRQSSPSSELERKLETGLKIRIITMHPDSQYLTAHNKIEQHTNADDISELIIWVSEMNKNRKIVNKIQLKLYDSLPLDFYCRSDDRVFVGPYCAGIPSGQVITYEYSYKDDGGKTYSNFFEKLWNNEYAKIPMLNQKKQLYKGDQKKAIESVLSHFCDLVGNENSRRKVIGVVAIFDQDKGQRRTFYSCNKSSTSNRHSIRPYHDGVVGIMNKLNGEKQGEYAVLYDYTTNWCYQYNLERHRLTIEKGEEPKEINRAAILTAPLIVNDSHIGVFSFDYTEQPTFLSDMKENWEEGVKKIFEHAAECAQILNELVVSYIELDYENQLEKW